MKKLITFPVMFAFLAAICAMNSAQAGGWKKSYHAGTFDKNFRYMGGTEIMFLESHKGRLYAGTSMLSNVFGIPKSISAQILVKESANARWKLDYQTDKQILRVDYLASITLGTDGQGNQLSQSVNLLIAGLCDIAYPLPPAATVAVRDDATNKWSKTDLIKLPAINYQVTIRAIRTHKDRITRVDRVFAGAYPGGIFSGVYDVSVPGQIRWDSAPEFSALEDRVISFGECNGELYAAIKPAIYKRIDGPTPTWEKVYEYTPPLGDKPSWQGGSSGIRGLTAIPNPAGDGEVLLMALEGLAIAGYSGNAKIMYLNPSDNNSVTTELDLDAFLREQFKERWSTKWYYVITAYNDMVQVTDPKTGEDLLMLGGVDVEITPSSFNADNSASWYLVRHADSSYTLHEVPYLFDFRGWPKDLMGIRSIRVSPFQAVSSQVIYMGGYTLGFTEKLHNTAWIYSADIDTVLGISK
jgi:poly(A) polymerase